MKPKHFIIIMSIICILVLTLAIVRSCNHLINPLKPTTNNQKPTTSFQLPVHESHKLFSTQGSQLQITIPPQKETTKLNIKDNLTVQGISPAGKSDSSNLRILESSNLRITKVVPIIRYHPTLHICYLMPISDSSLSVFIRGSFGLKIRILEIRRFGLTAHLNYAGIGPGIDFKLISNLSLDYAYLLNFSTLDPLNLGTFKPYLGLSVKL